MLSQERREELRAMHAAVFRQEAKPFTAYCAMADVNEETATLFAAMMSELPALLADLTAVERENRELTAKIEEMKNAESRLRDHWFLKFSAVERDRDALRGVMEAVSEELKQVSIQLTPADARESVRDELRHLMAVHLTENDGESAKAVAAFIHKHWATVYMALAEKGGGE